MPTRGHRGTIMEGLIVPTKIRKRGCSSSSSTSSRIHSYRLNKRAILVGKNRSGLRIVHEGSRSTTPVPLWRTTPLRSAIESPNYCQSAKFTQPVSARRLAATLWGMNDMHSPKTSECNSEMIKQHRKVDGVKPVSKREKMQPGWRLHLGSRYLPPHLSDPSHSPTISEKMDRSGTGSHQRRTPSISQRLRSSDQNVGALDSISNASFMEIETRSRVPTSSGSGSGTRNRLKDASNALTTSKELLKIINRIWAHADPPSSSMSLISALHAELERARLQINQFIQEYRSDKREINHLIKCFAEEKASWKSKEEQAVEAAVESIAGELEIERKLRRRLGNLNTKLGKELAEIKASFLKAAKELESEKRAREITEQTCDELAGDIDGERAEVEMLKRDSVKLFESKHQFEEKNSAIKKLRKQLEGFLGTKRDKEVANGTYVSKTKSGSHPNEQEGNGTVEDRIESKENSGDSDLHSIELNMDNNNNDKGFKWARASAVDREPRKLVGNDETMTRNSVSGHVALWSSSVQRSVSDCVESAIQDGGSPYLGEGVDRARYLLEKQAQSRNHLDDTYRYKSGKGLKDQALSRSKSRTLARDYHSLSEQNEQPWSSWDPYTMIQDKSRAIQMTTSKSRMAESQSTRTSKW
ncbi:hypothetical protein F511_42011 [Dorcoceras hygrometricum]|uniref:Uncharacterized protein n=1 Tax=Dorcoceras hygrometricum TaxID=472368 RepID=A0A2Z7AAD0_9LAMI|nr:hypothetical protein F511_42011 [Dorcoceras hygrometricum]